MPAPNTTTSEPAQLAGGGFLDDIVVPRDYQAGGQAMNPDMLKKLMMLKAMKQRQGVAGLPMNAFKRSDYAGGGIVAFQTGGSTFDQFMPEGSSDPGPIRETATKEQIAMMSLAELQEYYRTGKIPARLKSVTAPPKQVAPTDTPQAPGQKPDPKKVLEAPDAVQKYLQLDPERVLKETVRQTPQQFKEEREGLNKLFGVSADPYADLKRRYSEVEEEDKRTRAGQPMDQLTRFLSGIAGSRRGAGFGEAGAAGVAASSKLRDEQTALNRKQALDMAALQSAIAEKEDARARGDRDAYIAADQKVKDANTALQKDRIEMSRSQAQILNQNIQAQQAGRGGFPPERRAIMIQQAVQKRLDANPRVKILEISNKPEDKAELEQIKKKALADAIAEVQAIMNSMEGLGSLEGTSSLPPGVVVTKEKN